MAFGKLLTVLVLIHNAGGDHLFCTITPSMDLLEAEVQSSIIEGQNAKKGSWPWMVHLNITSEGAKKWRCGGTILNSEWVLTAASCWDPQLNPTLIRSMVWAGSHALQKGSSRFLGVLHAILHPRYQAVGKGYINDIALIKLKKKLSFSENVRPVILPSVNNNFGPSSECWIIGWGQVDKGVPLPDPEILQQLKIPIVPDYKCKDQYPELTSNMLCAGGKGKDACTGDYGGPLVCRGAKGFVQVGIMSYGSCGQGPGVYTQVSKYLRFINDYIHHAEEASAEV